MRASVLETKVIASEPGRCVGQGGRFALNEHGHLIIVNNEIEEARYCGWGTVLMTRTGDLLVAYSGDRDSHICPWGKARIIRSTDQGQTWSEPQTIISTPLDDRDCGLIQTQTGALLMTWFTSLAFAEAAPSPEWAQFGAAIRYARHGEKILPETRKKWLGNWVIRSVDGGETWGEPIRTRGTAPHGPIQLKNGRLLYIGIDRARPKSCITVEESIDDGCSWKLISEWPAETICGHCLFEPHVIELVCGKLLAMFRCHVNGRGAFLMQMESEDGGRTWSPPRSSGIWGYPPHLLQLTNGWVVMVYGHRRKPFGERACISRDNGKTWDAEYEIELASAPGPDLGYPSSTQLADGSILTVYYQASRLGAPTCIYGTRWRLC